MSTTTRRSISDLPEPSRGPSNHPLTVSVVLEDVALGWYELYKNSDKFTREKAIPELPIRASMMSMRCDRQFVYALREVPKSNPPGPASIYRMMLGQLVHDAMDPALALLPHFKEIDAEGNKHGWWPEPAIDLRPAGLAGSAHADIVWYEHGHPTMVVEVKTLSGFPFKKAATASSGGPDGPRWDHVMQAAVAAVALGAPRIVIGYFTMEPLSPAEAKRRGTNEIGRFTAEWEEPTSEWADEVSREVARQMRLVRLVEADPNALPERSLTTPEVPAGATVVNPASGNWHVLNDLGQVTNAGTKWFCSYCDWRDQCISDGHEAQITSVEIRL